MRAGEPMKALFFDFDGTLYIDGAISEDCRRELLRVKDLGHRVILNTGRSYGFLPREARDESLFDGMICGSSYVRFGGRVIENLTLDRPTLKAAYNWGAERALCVVFEGVEENFSVNGQLRDASEIFAREKLPMITKVTMWCDPARVRGEDLPLLRIVRFQNYAEGIHPGRDKTSGMQTILRHLGLDFNDAVAFGDSENDEEMLRAAGVGVCMASAPADFDRFCALRAKTKDGVPETLRILF